MRIVILITIVGKRELWETEYLGNGYFGKLTITLVKILLTIVVVVHFCVVVVIVVKRLCYLKDIKTFIWYESKV